MLRSVWFQNLKKDDRTKKLLHVRGNIGRSWDDVWLKYEVSTGPAFRFEIELDEEDGGTQVSLGLLFISFWLTFTKLKLPVLKPGREYGFYLFEWHLWLYFGRRKHESRHDDPWYYKIVIDFPKLLFGRQVHFDAERLKSYSPVLFEFRGKTYQMDEIRLTQGHWFRERVPVALYCQKVMRMHLDIKKPPGYAGKGENSWDLDDNASYGMTCPYEGPTPRFNNQDEVFEICCRKYCEDVSKSIKRYGRASGDDVSSDEIGFKYLGRKRDEDCPAQVEPEAGVKG